MTPPQRQRWLDVACGFCGCACDDLNVDVEGGRIIGIENACESARGSFLAGEVPADKATDFSIVGEPVGYEQAVSRAADLLTEAEAPFIYGLTRMTSEAQCAAVELADRIGGRIDTPAGLFCPALGTPLQQSGVSSCTFGEVRQRADVIVFWQCDPERTHPRFRKRYCPDGSVGPGAGGSRGAFVICVGDPGTKTATKADQVLPVSRGREYEAAGVVRGLIAGHEMGESAVFDQTGVSLAEWKLLAERLRTCHYGVIVCEERQAGLSDWSNRYDAAAVHQLAIDVCNRTRCSVVTLRGPGNPVSAEMVFTWQTGFPCSVDLVAGYPRYGPAEFSLERSIARREADLVVIVGEDWDHGLESICGRLGSVPWILIEDRAWADLPARPAPTIRIRTAAFGVATPGTLFRADGVPLPLPRLLESPFPDAGRVLADMLARVARATPTAGGEP